MNEFAKVKFESTLQAMLGAIEAGMMRPHGQDPVISALRMLRQTLEPSFSFLGETGPEFKLTAQAMLNKPYNKGLLETASRHSNRSTSGAARTLLSLLH